MYDIVNKEEIDYAKIFALFLNAVLIVDMLRMVINSSLVVSLVQYVIYIGCAVYVFWQIMICDRFKIDKNLFGLIGISIIIALISYFICPDIVQAYGYYLPFFLTRIIPALYFPIYLNGRKLNITFRYLIKYRFLWIIYALIGMIWVPLHTPNQYSITYGYNLLIPAIVVFYYFIRYRKIKWILYGAVFFALMLLRGSRASALCLLVFIMLAYIMIHKENTDQGKIVRILLLMFIGGIVLLNFKNIALALSSVFPSSRTLALLSSNIKFDSGRSDIQSLYWKAISQHPLKFNGIFSDRIYYSDLTKSGYDMTNYPHNFIVELFYQWGIPLGLLIVIIITGGIIKCIWYSNKMDNSELICFVLIMFVTGFLKLFFSASYLVTVEFYLLIGIIIRICRENGFNNEGVVQR